MFGIARNDKIDFVKKRSTDIKCHTFEAKAMFYLASELDSFLNEKGIQSSQIVSWEILQDCDSRLYCGILLYV